MESSTAAAPAISLERLLPNLQEYCFSERTVRIFQHEPRFEELTYRSHQIYFVNEFTQRNDGHFLSLRQLSRVFECDAARVNAALKNGLDDPQSRGRHSALDDASEIEILEWIQKQAEKFNPITRTDLLYYFQANYSCSISRGWVNSFILRYREDLREVKSTPQEHPRLEAAREFLDETTRCLRDNINGMKVELFSIWTKSVCPNGRIAKRRK
jgi:hypothetical protein